MFPILSEHIFAQVMAHNKTKENAPNWRKINQK